MTAHKTRVDVALALGGFVAFCSCKGLTGFADTAAGADKIAADHVAKAAVTASYPHQVGCGCACCFGGFCGGCGHAGCGGAR